MGLTRCCKANCHSNVRIYLTVQYGAMWMFLLYCLYSRTVAVDMRGYGDSDKPCSINEYTMDKLVDDVHQLITELGLSFFKFPTAESLTSLGQIRG